MYSLSILFVHIYKLQYRLFSLYFLILSLAPRKRRRPNIAIVTLFAFASRQKVRQYTQYRLHKYINHLRKQISDSFRENGN